MVRHGATARRSALAAIILLAAWTPAAAHETKAVGGMRLTVGWGEEPAFSGFRNFVEVDVADGAGHPVVDLGGGALSAEVSFGDERIPLSLRAGAWTAGQVPRVAGAHEAGNIQLSYHRHDQGPGDRHDVDLLRQTFACVADVSDIQFPVKDPSAGQLADRISRELPRAEGAMAAASRRPDARHCAASPAPSSRSARQSGSACERAARAADVARWTAAGLLLAAMLASGGGGTAYAHAVLRIADPPEGATLDNTPAAVRLTFSETPDVSLSEIRVVGTTGAAYQVGRPVLVPNDPLSISINVAPLDRGVYTVSWRIVSAVDGHTTTGAHAFGVREDPSAVALAPASGGSAVAVFPIFARWMVLTGLVLLAGAAAAAIGRFGGRSDVVIGGGGALLAFVGVVLLAIGQSRTASVSFADLWNSSVGRSLLWRLIAIAVAGAALVSARRREVTIAAR